MDQSKITEPQIESIANSLKKTLRGHAQRLPTDAVQLVIDHEIEKLQEDLFQGLLPRVRRRAGMIARTTTVNRDLPPSKLVRHFPKYPPMSNYRDRVDPSILRTIPKQGKGIETVTLFFFKPENGYGYYDYESILRDCGLEPDYYAQIQANLDDLQFSKEHGNGAIFGEGRWGGYKTQSYHIFSYLSVKYSPVEECDSNDIDRWKPVLRCFESKSDRFYGYIAGRLLRDKTKIVE